MTAAGPDSLLERGAELDGLTRSLAAARAARGSVALLEAPAGQGKTALLRVLRAQAAAAGLRVLGATGRAARARLRVRDRPPALRRRAAPRRPGAPRARCSRARRRWPSRCSARAVAEGEDASHSTLYGLYWLCANLAAEQPLLVVVDDAHWADAPSLRFLDALARRVEDLPVLLALAARPAEPGAEQELLDGLATAPATRLLRPAALSPAGVGALVRARIDADPEFVEACFETTRGNPLLLTELLRAAPFEGRASEADDVRTTVPGTVARTVTARHPAAVARARSPSRARPRCSATRPACAASPRCRACRSSAAAAELEVLARADLIDAAEGRFVHPMVLEVVEADLGAERSLLHRRAARLLADDGALRRRRRHPPARRRARARPVGGGRARRRRPPRAGRGRAGRRPAPARPRRPGRRRASCSRSASPSSAPAPTRCATLDEAAATGTPEIAAEATRLAATALVLRSEPRAAAARLRAALETAPPELAGELEEQLVEALAYSDDDADEYLERLAIESAERARRATAPRPTLLVATSRHAARDSARRAAAIAHGRCPPRAARARPDPRRRSPGSASSASRRCGRSRRCSRSRRRRRRWRRRGR